MAMESGFLDKLIERLDRLDPKSLQTQFLRVVQERGLLETIFQSIQEGIMVVDRAGRLSYGNRAAERMLGFSTDSAKGRSITVLLRGIDWERLLQLDGDEWSKLINTEIEIGYPEHRYVNFYVVPLADTEASEGGAVIILRDVTRERENEQDLVQSERLNAVKLLAAGVAHEIGNPLNALNIHLQLLDREIERTRNSEPGTRNLEEEGEAEDLKELVRVARDEVARLDLIITQFLRAIRPGQPTLVPCSVETLLEETLTLLRQEIQNRKIEVHIDKPGTLPKIRVDRGQIKQAFFNVIKNAFQAMPDGGALAITLAVSSEFLEIAFQDTGVGIDAADLGQIFEPYHTTKSEGSGLGLMIVQRIVHDHGGQIEVDSKPEAGTRFVILLPLAERRTRLLQAHTADELRTGGKTS